MWVFLAGKSAGGKERTLIVPGGRQETQDETMYKRQELHGRFCSCSLLCLGEETAELQGC